MPGSGWPELSFNTYQSRLRFQGTLRWSDFDGAANGHQRTQENSLHGLRCNALLGAASGQFIKSCLGEMSIESKSRFDPALLHHNK